MNNLMIFITIRIEILNYIEALLWRWNKRFYETKWIKKTNEKTKHMNGNQNIWLCIDK